MTDMVSEKCTTETLTKETQTVVNVVVDVSVQEKYITEREMKMLKFGHL